VDEDFLGALGVSDVLSKLTASSGEGIVFEHEAVVEADAVILAAAAGDGVFVECASGGCGSAGVVAGGGAEDVVYVVGILGGLRGGGRGGVGGGVGWVGGGGWGGGGGVGGVGGCGVGVGWLCALGGF